jgi:ketosteroid isomerase-like protein
MSQENVDALKAAFEASNRRDRDAFFALCDPDAEFHLAGIVMDQQRVYRGREEIWEWLTAVDSEFTDLRAEPEDLFDAGDKVVVAIRFHGRGKASGATVDLRFASVVTMKDGRIARGDNYVELEQALEAAGLSGSA